MDIGESELEIKRNASHWKHVMKTYQLGHSQALDSIHFLSACRMPLRASDVQLPNLS